MNKLLSFLFVFISTAAVCQTDEFYKPDFKQIEKNTGDKSSLYYFPALMDRYNRADSTMTIEEKRHLYYGYSFSKDYSPYKTSESQEDLNEILRSQKTDARTMEKMLKVSDKVLKDFPFSIRIKEFRIFALKQLEHYAAAKAEETQASIIIDAILSTGDGTTKEKSFYVISTTNEYELLDIMGFRFGGKQKLIEHRYDYLTLAENPYNLEGFYFDVSRLFDSFSID